MIVRSVDVVRVGVCMSRMCVYDSEDRDHGVGSGVNDTVPSETL